MARPHEFDMGEALDAALNTFWTQGYEATSLTDLMEPTVLHKGSLHKAFEDKHHLFMKSLTPYLNSAWAISQATLTGAKTPLDGLRSWLEGAAQLCSKQRVHRGCMAMNTAVELRPHDGEIAKSCLIFTAGLVGTSKVLDDTIDFEEMVATQIQCITPQ